MTMTNVPKSLTFFSRIRLFGGPVDVVWPAGRFSTWARGSSTSRETAGMLVTVLELETDRGELGNSSSDIGSSEGVMLGRSGVIFVVFVVEVCGWLVNEPANIWGAYEIVTSKNKCIFS
jgi:hypothetical protein